MRHILAILAVALATTAAQAQLTVHVTTNNFNNLNPERDALTNSTGTIRIRHTIDNGVIPLDLSQASGLALRIIDAQDGYTNNIPVVVVTNSPGVVFWEFALFNERTYRMRASVTIPGDTFPVFDRFLTVTSTPAQASAINITNINEITLGAVTVGVQIAEGAVTVDSSVILTNIITIENNTYVQTTITSTGGTVGVESDGTNYNLEVLGGVGGMSAFPILDYTNQTFSATQIQFSVSFMVTTNEYGVLISRSDAGGFPLDWTGTNVTTYAPNWSTTLGGLSPTNLYHVCSSTTTQLIIKAWGGAALNSPGGYSEISLAHPTLLQSAVLDVQVGQGGYARSNSVVGVLEYIPGSWPNGGAGLVRSNAVGSAGGGATIVSLVGGDIFVVAGGGGAQTSQGFGIAGGVTALPLNPSASSGQGGGYSSTTGGLVATTSHATYLWTNTAGGYLKAGEPGWATNVTSSTVLSLGAGGGYWGGGGGIAAATTSGAGGGGNGWVNLTNVASVFGLTLRGVGTTPPNIEEPNYITGRAVANVGTTIHNTYSGHGMVIIYER